MVTSEELPLTVKIEDDSSAPSAGEEEVDIKHSNAVAPFPFKVAKALDPTIYRNIEYDSWGEVRRGKRYFDLLSLR